MNDRIRRPIMIPLALGLVILLSGFMYTFYRVKTNQNNEEVLTLVNAVSEQFQWEIERDAEFMVGLLDFIEQDESIRQAWLAADREQLLKSTQPIFEHIRSRYQITHFYFHDLDRVNFLRVHNPDKHSDYIKRFTMGSAVEKGKTTHGIELGKLGTFTLRVVLPWLIDGDLVGYIELGEEIEHITQRLQTALELDFIILIDKQFIRYENWANGQRLLDRHEDWDEYKQKVVMCRTIDIPAGQIQPWISQDITENRDLVFSAEVSDQKYRSSFVPLRDAGGRKVGRIVAFLNTTDQAFSSLVLMRTILLTAILVVLILLGFFWYHIGNIEKHLISFHNQLAAAKLELEDRNQQLNQEQTLLNRSHSALRNILAKVPFGVVLIDKKKTIRWLNHAVLKMIDEGSEDDIIGKKCGDYLCGAGESECPILDLNQEVDNSERVLRTREGKEIPIIKSVMEVNFDGEDMLLEALIDIRDRKQMEIELGQARKLESVGQLAAGIAHEINTPAQFVSNNINFFKESMEDVLKLIAGYQNMLNIAQERSLSTGEIEGIEQLLEEIDWDYLKEEIPSAIGQSQDGINRISNIVRAMKEFSHPGNREKTPKDLNEVIETTVIIARNEWKYVAEMQLDLLADLPQVNCLVDEIGQVFLNIIVNAAHAIGGNGNGNGNGKGLIKVNSSVRDDWVEIRIEDNGGGIPASAQEHIFDPFFTTKDVGKGTGQGLTIAYDVVTVKHDGKLTFETEEGVGTSFIVRLPIAMPAA